MGIYETRLNATREAMRERAIDCLVLTPGAGMRYLTGFSSEGHERLLCLIVPRERDWLFITPALNAEQVRTNPAGVTDIRAWDDTAGWQTTLENAACEIGLDKATIGVDPQMAARFVLGLQDAAPGARFLAGDVLAGMRIVKDEGEIAAMERAAAATDNAIAAAFKACVPGATELDVQLAIEGAIYAQGGELSFAPIVGSGSNSALPHHNTGMRRLAKGDVAVLDFGARIDGYCGDITRTVAVGEASDEARHVYDIVYAAHQAALQTARGGVAAQSVDAAARKVIEDAGYGQFFIHRTGHGIGLEEHELPNIVAGNEQILAPGMCFSIEPGIYLSGKLGVRLENIVTIDDNGHCRALNTAISATLPVVGREGHEIGDP